MSDKKMNGKDGLGFDTVWKLAKEFVVVAVFIATIAISGAHYTGKIVQEFRGYAVASELRDDGQDVRLTGLDEKYDAHDTRINGVEMIVVKLDLAGEDAEFLRAITLVQEAIDCQALSGDDVDWIMVPGADCSALPELMRERVRVRVEEHFRALRYKVVRERQLVGGRGRGFWILIEQS